MLAFILTVSIAIFFVAMTKYGLEEQSILKLKPKMGKILIEKSFRRKLRKEIEQEYKQGIMREKIINDIIDQYREYYENKIKKLSLELEELKKQKIKIIRETNEDVIREFKAKYEEKLQQKINTIQRLDTELKEIEGIKINYERELKQKTYIINKLNVELGEIKEKIYRQKENYKNYLKNKEENFTKGKNYEYKIKCYFEDLGYSVYPNGYINGKKDKGIDLIAYKGNEVHLIQCKCYKNPPKQELLRKFVGDCEIYIKNNQEKFKNKIIYKDFITSCKEKDYGVIKFLEENKNLINYLIIE